MIKVGASYKTKSGKLIRIVERCEDCHPEFLFRGVDGTPGHYWFNERGCCMGGDDRTSLCLEDPRGQPKNEGEMEKCRRTTPQDQWRDIFDESALTLSSVCSVFGLNRSSLNAWLSVRRTPNSKNREIMHSIVEKLKMHPRIKPHPSYGYATPEQIERLNEIGLCPERDMILKQIEK